MNISKAADMAAKLALLLTEVGLESRATRGELVGAATILLVSMADAAGVDEETTLEAVRACFRDLRRAGYAGPSTGTPTDAN